MKQEIIERTIKDCEMCHHPIIDQYYLTVGDFMAVHQNCLRCATCSRLIDDEQKKCFYRERKFYCATPDCSCYIGHHDFDTVSSASSTNNDDYYHISDLSSSSSSSSSSTSSSISSSIRQQRQHQQQSFWSSCYKCLRPIEQNQYFIRLNQKLYHMECFRCSKCLCRIDPGSPYGLLDDILCENHYYETRNDRKPQQQQLVTDKTSKNQSDLNNNISTINNHQSETTTITNANKNNGTTNPISTSSVIRPLKIDSSNLQQQTTNRFQNETLSIAKTSTTSGSSSRKKKRVRTSFKHQQLRMMKAHFLLNQNPDSKELKELSEKTGLQKRVLQVWFQNSRAKQRKCSSALPSPSTSGSFIDCTRSSVGQSLNGAVTPMTTMSHHIFSHPQRHHLLLQHPTIASSVGHSQQHQQHLPSSVGDEDEDEDDDDNSEGSDSDDDLTTLDMDEQPSDSTATSEYYFDFV